MSIDSKQSRRILTGFSEWAPTYNEDTKGQMLWASPRHLVSMLRPHLANGQCILDLGCGTGQAPTYAANLKMHWTGVDLCRDMLSQAKATGKYAEIHKMNIERKRYPFKNSVFDNVLASGVFEFTSRIESVLKEIHRTLKPGGRVAFSVELAPPNADFDILDSDEYHYIRFRYSESRVRESLQTACFRLESSDSIDAYRNEDGEFVRYACFLACRG